MNQLEADPVNKVIITLRVTLFCFSCRNVTVVSLSLDIDPPRVTIVANSTQIAGQPHTLMCHVSIISGHSPVINWLDPYEQVLNSNEDITVEVVLVIGAPTTEIQYALRFRSIHTLHAGVYFCKATVHSFHYTLNTTTTKSKVVFVQSMFPVVSCVIPILLLCFYHMQWLCLQFHLHMWLFNH